MFLPIIFTRGRADNQVTLGELPSFLKSTAIMLVYPHEYEEHKERFGSICEVMATPPEVKGIGPRRGWAAKNFRGHIQWQLDDDLTFCKAKDGDTMYEWPFVKFGPMTEEDWHELVNDITRTCDLGVRVGGIGQRIAPAGIDSYPGALNSRVYTNTYYDLRSNGIDPHTIDWVGNEWDIDELCPEDFHVQCQLVKQGEIVMNWNKYGSAGNKTQASGGCSEIRTLDNHNKGMIKFAEVWEECSTLRWKDAWEANKQKAALTIRLGKLTPISKPLLLDIEDQVRKATGALPKAKAKELQKRANVIREEAQKEAE